MEQRISPSAFLFATLVIAMVLLGATVTLPHDRYDRFQAHDNVTTRKADWIYERLHFDKTPVDVALIGTSRMAGGLSAPKIEAAYCQATGRRIHVANLAIPVTGRNMHYVIAREATETKAPALVVVELNDIESRRPHAGFIFLADARDVISAPLLINLNYFSDLARLPGRQLELFFRDITGDAPLRSTYDAAAYRGAHFDLTATQIAIDGRTTSRDVYLTADELEARREVRLKNVNPVYMLPKFLRRMEYRFSKHYFEKIKSSVAQTDGELRFSYLPAYGAEEIPDPLLTELNITEPIIDLGGALAADPNNWLDATHFNQRGAEIASFNFANDLALENPSLGRPTTGCSFAD